jgi:hypothetical protein
LEAAVVDDSVDKNVKVSTRELMGASNVVGALFGMKMKETLTCDEVPEIKKVRFALQICRHRRQSSTTMTRLIAVSVDYKIIEN